MEIQSRPEATTLILTLSGRMTMLNCERARDAFLKSVEQEWRRIGIDLSGLKYMDSAGLAVLVEIVQLARAYGARVCFFSVPPPVYAIIEVSNLHQLLPLARNETAAFQELTVPASSLDPLEGPQDGCGPED